jgi:hypothetical protein
MHGPITIRLKTPKPGFLVIREAISYIHSLQNGYVLGFAMFCTGLLIIPPYNPIKNVAKLQLVVGANIWHVFMYVLKGRSCTPHFIEIHRLHFITHCLVFSWTYLISVIALKTKRMALIYQSSPYSVN